jgi:hypothetical protein
VDGAGVCDAVSTDGVAVGGATADGGGACDAASTVGVAVGGGKADGAGACNAAATGGVAVAGTTADGAGVARDTASTVGVGGSDRVVGDDSAAAWVTTLTVGSRAGAGADGLATAVCTG